MQNRRGPGQFKVKFTPVEDQRLAHLVAQWGANSWSLIASQMPGRNPRQCRERWTNYVNPIITYEPWTPEQEALLEQKFAEYGTQWHAIAVFFPSRSKNQIKNHWVSKHKAGGPPGMPRPEPIRMAEPQQPFTEVSTCQVQPKPCASYLFPGQSSADFNWEEIFAGFF
jgi:hypothetical protein